MLMGLCPFFQAGPFKPAVPTTGPSKAIQKSSHSSPLYPLVQRRTDPALFAKLDKVFRFTVDTCADADNALLPRYWTNAARKDWRSERVFCNPPFAGLAPIIAKAPTAQLCVMVHMLNALTAKYFHEHTADFLLLPPRRLKFIPPEEIEERGINFGTGLLVYGRISDGQRRQLKDDWLIYRL